MAAELCGEGVEVERRIVEGEPFEEIVRAAEEEKVDLILIATNGHRGFKRMFMGSTAERVVRMATCPVMTIREGQTE